MRTIFRDPEVEEGVSNVILQNRCGNRLTLLVHETHSDMELVYKPNAYRRKEHWARNFSNRDNFTTLFAGCRLEELRAPFVKEIAYDPFVTRVGTLAASGARNAITVVNVVDENCFAIAARGPLTLAVKPKRGFAVGEGLLTEGFVERGEGIVSFVSFPGMAENRYRVLEDGTHIVQLLENDVVLIGGEENEYQVGRVLRLLRGLSLEELMGRNEKLLENVMAGARMVTGDAEVGRVLDINKRFVYGSIDEGGACFGALNRIYHLIWTRDGSMAASHYALAGFPQVIKLWAPFLLANPARITDKGRTITAWQQIVGSRWTKAEDDGLFYAAWTLFTHFQTTGDDALVRSGAFEILLEGLENAIATGLDAKLGLFVSDTRGESTLASSPYYGYDIVNGKMDTERIGSEAKGKAIARCASCYINVGRYNVLRMVEILLGQRPELRGRFGRDYGAMARELGERIDGFFLAEGKYRAEWLVYSDGTSDYPDWKNIDYWEYGWALSLMPFHPNIGAAVASAREYVGVWPKVASYGFPPWNTLLGLLMEYGMPSGEARGMMEQEVREALLVTRKYPMAGLLTEYAGATESWRGLPFTAGSFTALVAGTLLKGLPQGVAVRAGGLVDSIGDFSWMNYHIDASAHGVGEAAVGVRVNGRELMGSLQIPHSLLRPGKNMVEVTRGGASRAGRLYSSTLMLLEVRGDGEKRVLEFGPSALGEVVLENAAEAVFRDGAGRVMPVEGSGIAGTGLTVYRVEAGGGLTVEVSGEV